MRTARFPSSGGGLPNPPAGRPPPPSDANPLVMWPVMYAGKPTPPPLLVDAGHVTCDACWEAKPPLPMDRMTDMCKNITLSRISFVGGYYTQHPPLPPLTHYFLN